MRKLSPKAIEMLRSFYEDGEATDLCDFDGASALGWGNRERVIDALIRRGLLDKDAAITDAGRQLVERLQPAAR
jgi:hypothetical protein